ncbi:MAG: hypothetical protein WAM96_10865 [Candidatus Acidiferrales bacterium]
MNLDYRFVALDLLDRLASLSMQFFVWHVVVTKSEMQRAHAIDHLCESKVRLEKRATESRIWSVVLVRAKDLRQAKKGFGVIPAQNAR